MSDRLFFGMNVLLGHLPDREPFTAGATHLVTRDVAGFRKSEVPVVGPDAYLAGRAED